MDRIPDDNFRTLNISNFRNIAPLATSDGDGRQFLKINRSLRRDEIGGLVIIIGGNNCGKSNVLDAVERSYNADLITEDDSPNFILINELVTPKLFMNVANNKYSKSSAADGRKVKGTYYDYFTQILFEKESFNIYCDRYEDSDYTEDDYRSKMKEILENSELYDSKIFKGITKTILSDRNDCDAPIIKEISQIINNDSVESLKDHILQGIVERPGILIKDAPRFTTDVGTFKETYGYTLSNKVYRFTPTSLKDSDFKCKPTELSQFLINLLEKLDCPINHLSDNIYGRNKDIVRIKEEEKINKKLKDRICNKFNKFFKMQEKQYSMNLRFESDCVSFMLTCGDNMALSINKQSEGFRWIFDFFFNSIVGSKYKPGDIIIIDEFGNGLNFGTIEELGHELRRFSKENGITFVLGTQNPMVIDTDYLDEVRLVIPKEDGSSIIVNDFNNFSDHYESDSHDVLRPILNGMTVSRNYMRTENRRTIFVEGITDYFYLSSFAKKMRENNIDVDIDFLPINGVGAAKDNPELLIKTLISIERYSPIIFTDSDWAGARLASYSKSHGLSQIQIKDIFRDKTEIEDLFSNNDRIELEVDRKSFDISACFAHNFDSIYAKLDEETIDNFTKVIEYLKDC